MCLLLVLVGAYAHDNTVATQSMMTEYEPHFMNNLTHGENIGGCLLAEKGIGVANGLTLYSVSTLVVPSMNPPPFTGVKCGVRILLDGAKGHEKGPDGAVPKVWWQRCPTGHKFLGSPSTNGRRTTIIDGATVVGGYKKGFVQLMTAECVMVMVFPDVYRQIDAFQLQPMMAVVGPSEVSPRNNQLTGQKPVVGAAPDTFTGTVMARMPDKCPSSLRARLSTMFEHSYCRPLADEGTCDADADDCDADADAVEAEDEVISAVAMKKQKNKRGLAVRV
jgi:hypothetical protein